METGVVNQTSDLAPRVIAGLCEGRIVNYVMNNGEIRPLLIVNAWDRTGSVNGILFFDGTNDRGKHPQTPLAETSGHVLSCVQRVTSAHYDDGTDEQGNTHPFVPGSWHFPRPIAVMAAGVDPGALKTQLEAVLLEALNGDFKAKLEGAVHEALLFDSGFIGDKLQAHLEATKALVDSGLAEFRAVAEIKTAPAETSAADLDMRDTCGMMAEVSEAGTEPQVVGKVLPSGTGGQPAAAGTPAPSPEPTE